MDNKELEIKLLNIKKEETKVMNIEDVYLDNGIDLASYEVLTFKESIKIS